MELIQCQEEALMEYINEVNHMMTNDQWHIEKIKETIDQIDNAMNQGMAQQGHDEEKTTYSPMEVPPSNTFAEEEEEDHSRDKGDSVNLSDMSTNTELETSYETTTSAASSFTPTLSLDHSNRKAHLSLWQKTLKPQLVHYLNEVLPSYFQILNASMRPIADFMIQQTQAPFAIGNSASPILKTWTSIKRSEMDFVLDQLLFALSSMHGGATSSVKKRRQRGDEAITPIRPAHLFASPPSTKQPADPSPGSQVVKWLNITHVHPLRVSFPLLATQQQQQQQQQQTTSLPSRFYTWLSTHVASFDRTSWLLISLGGFSLCQVVLRCVRDIFRYRKAASSSSLLSTLLFVSQFISRDSPAILHLVTTLLTVVAFLRSRQASSSSSSTTPPSSFLSSTSFLSKQQKASSMFPTPSPSSWFSSPLPSSSFASSSTTKSTLPSSSSSSVDASSLPLPDAYGLLSLILSHHRTLHSNALDALKRLQSHAVFASTPIKQFNSQLSTAFNVHQSRMDHLQSQLVSPSSSKSLTH